MKVFCFIFLLFCAQLSAAEIYYPVSARTPAKLQESSVEFDHARIRLYKTNISGAPLELSYLAKFAVGPNDPRYNLTFIIPEQPTIKCGIAVFNKGDFIPTVSQNTIQAYISGLHKKGIKEIQSTATQELESDLVILGERPEMIIYTQKEIKHLDYILEHNSRIYFFSFEAPENLFQNHLDSARLLFARISLSNER